MQIYLPEHVVAELEGRDGYQRKHESNHLAFERLRKAERKRRLRQFRNLTFQDQLQAALTNK